MSYTPTEWKSGDVVTSAKLNKIEEGIAHSGGVLVVHDVDGTLDKTWQEIHDALPLVYFAQDYGTFNWFFYASSSGDVFFTGYIKFGPGGAVMKEYSANSADGYPVAKD